jgi:hypothetical protein
MMRGDDEDVVVGVAWWWPWVWGLGLVCRIAVMWSLSVGVRLEGWRETKEGGDANQKLFVSFVLSAYIQTHIGQPSFTHTPANKEKKSGAHQPRKYHVLPLNRLSFP